ncbi:MAG: hypothetical protein IKT29_02995, partial [Flavobacteriales bacterium]|nr:hypothetical protein [Flavobacteriales bacterium]
KIYKYSQMSDLKQLAAGFEDVFYIVDKNRRDVLGPMDIKEYVEMREKLGVPDDMTLKVKLKI